MHATSTNAVDRGGGGGGGEFAGSGSLTIKYKAGYPSPLLIMKCEVIRISPLPAQHFPW